MPPSRNKKFLAKRKSKLHDSKFKKKKESDRDVKHTDQFQEYYQRKRKEIAAENRRKVPREEEIEYEDEVEEYIDPLSQLLSTFGGKNVKKVKAIESDSEYESEEDDYVEHAGGLVDLCEKIGATDVAETNNPSDESEDETKEDEPVEEKDPFTQHLNYDLSNKLLEAVTDFKHIKKETVFWPVLNKLNFEVPSPDSKGTKTDKNYSLLEVKENAPLGKIPTLKEHIDLKALCIKAQIEKHIAKANAKQLKLSLDTDNKEILTPLQTELFTIINNYQDLLYCEKRFQTEEEIRFVYCLHVANHILKTRTKIIQHNEKLLKKSKTEIPDEYRDQGLVRPRVLILVPFRDSCYRIVNMLISLLLSDEKPNVINRTRFNEEFSGSELQLPKKNPKPEDYEQIFKGNIDDTFKIGIGVTKKSLKLYCDFYSSDVIIASPLGLRLIIGAEGEKERDYDFLSSIEMLILDQTELFPMQNWDHLLHIFDHMHLQPQESHDTDICRIRSWALNGWTKYYRQTMIFSSLLFPDLLALFNRKCQNYAGKVHVNNLIEVGSISQIVVTLPQVFNKFKASSILESIEVRFQMLTEKILPQFKDSIMSGVLIYIPSYFDYVRIRNYFKKEELSFSQICEYSKDAKVARARDMFYHNQTHFLLYSERFHFYRRIRLKGIRHVIFYQPPYVPHFYSEICNLMQESNQNKFLHSDSNLTVSVLYCKYDVYQLSAIVSSARASRMLSSEKDVHLFTSKQ